MPIFNGYGQPYPAELALEEMENYVGFDEAAPQIHYSWKRHHIHKEMTMNRVFLSQILIVEDTRLFYTTDWNKGRKFFIHKDEIKRLKEDYATRRLRREERCLWCKRVKRYCIKDKCAQRYERSTEKRDDDAARKKFIDTWTRRAQTLASGKSKELAKLGKQSDKTGGKSIG